MMTAMKGSVVAWVKLMVRKNSAIATAAEEQLGGRVSNLRAIWALWYSMTLWIWVTLLAASWFNQFSQRFVLRMVFPDYPTSFCCRITGYDSIQMASPLPNIGTWWPWGGFVLVLHLAARGVPQLPEDTVWFHWGPGSTGVQAGRGDDMRWWAEKIQWNCRHHLKLEATWSRCANSPVPRQIMIAFLLNQVLSATYLLDRCLDSEGGSESGGCWRRATINEGPR